MRSMNRYWYLQSNQKQKTWLLKHETPVHQNRNQHETLDSYNMSHSLVLIVAIYNLFPCKGYCCLYEPPIEEQMVVKRKDNIMVRL
jgi:hypothetical protein